MDGYQTRLNQGQEFIFLQSDLILPLLLLEYLENAKSEMDEDDKERLELLLLLLQEFLLQLEYLVDLVG
jgi:hypothetical protein